MLSGVADGMVTVTVPELVTPRRQTRHRPAPGQQRVARILRDVQRQVVARSSTAPDATAPTFCTVSVTEKRGAAALGRARRASSTP